MLTTRTPAAFLRKGADTSKHGGLCNLASAGIPSRSRSGPSSRTKAHSEGQGGSDSASFASAVVVFDASAPSGAGVRKFIRLLGKCLSVKVGLVEARCCRARNDGRRPGRQRRLGRSRRGQGGQPSGATLR